MPGVTIQRQFGEGAPLSNRAADAALQRPFAILGENPLFIDVLSWLWLRNYGLVSAESGSFYQGFLPFATPEIASLLFALAHLLPL